MRDNFLQDEYQPYNEVYRHETGNKIFLGDVTAAVQKTIIEKQKIGFVVTAAIDMEHVTFDSSIKHIRFDVFDSKTQNLSKLFQKFYQLTEKQLKRTNMLVHCFAGVSRSATLVIAYLMKKNNWSFRDAITQVRKYRPKVLPNLGFERQLKEYEKKLLGFEPQLQRKNVSKTSQSKKHVVKQKNIGLPELFGLGSTITRSKMIEHIQDRPSFTPITPIEPRRGLKISKTSKQKNQLFPMAIAQTQPLQTKRIQLRSFRKRSISINKNQLKSKQELDLYSRNGYRSNMKTVFRQKINLNQVNVATQNNIRHLALRQYNYGH